MNSRRRSIDFARIAGAALVSSETIVTRWLPYGRRDGAEWTAKNPKRADSRPGSFRVNLRSGRWADFATDDKGGDLVSLAAFLFDLRQDEAALKVAEMIGVDPYGR
ncbi:hypothetical protein [Methylosinus sp. KRF6]|uniref:hypothetical protein n=1 Tax=Methylosinus sp. KRF6 TaxID=2846853 RepID=UPI001C0CE36F|nr:hypothetical protein [Methylosinus sp. KRF6]MBU3887217.1 hypothetical protein [Methylosinus sp. KRF6]